MFICTWHIDLFDSINKIVSVDTIMSQIYAVLHSYRLLKLQPFLLKHLFLRYMQFIHGSWLLQLETSVDTFTSQIHSVIGCWKKVVIARLVSATDDTQPSEVSSWPTSIHQGRLHLGPNPSILLEMLSLKCFVFIWAWLLVWV